MTGQHAHIGRFVYTPQPVLTTHLISKGFKFLKKVKVTSVKESYNKRLLYKRGSRFEPNATYGSMFHTHNYTVSLHKQGI